MPGSSEARRAWVAGCCYQLAWRGQPDRELSRQARQLTTSASPDPAGLAGCRDNALREACTCDLQQPNRHWQVAGLYVCLPTLLQGPDLDGVTVAAVVAAGS